ncbi:MAG: DEAD/DEAH box helicase [Bacteroidetes bacterium]|nr:DEAD/DEAH box helicase [Bacteroidota bacterium]
MKYIPHPYQEFATEHVIDNPEAGLFLDMGLGKTVSTLTAVDRLMNDYFEISKVLVIAPKRVAEDTWTTESAKWDHLKHLRLSVVLGSERERKEALKAKADIYVINRENVAWLVGYYQSAFPFDMIVIDELSSFKSAKAIRFKSLRMIRPKVKRVVGLTGTPAPNGLIDLWPQMYLLDQGARLGKTISGYREKYFTPGKRNSRVVFNYNLKTESERAIYDKIGDICISMKTEDYLSLPGRVNHTIEVKLPKTIQEKYDEFEKQQVLSILESDTDISAVNAAALSTKLRQFANGAVYDAEKNYHVVHDEKLEALEEVVEAANGQPVLIFYSFKHDLERIQKRLKGYKPRVLEGKSDIADWNEGKIQVMLAHPASAGHGLNLQAGGNIVVWFGLNWSLELYQQANARLDRQGQIKPVIIYHLITVSTIDQKVFLALEGKAEGQDALLNAVKAIINKYKKVA